MKKVDLEMIIGTISMAAIALFFCMIIIAMISSCSNIRFRLPDRDHPLCKVPWNSRIDCLDDSDCPQNHVCAHRGRAIGKCTYIDCCEPWRHGPRFLSTADWCTHIEESEDN